MPTSKTVHTMSTSGAGHRSAAFGTARELKNTLYYLQAPNHETPGMKILQIVMCSPLSPGETKEFEERSVFRVGRTESLMHRGHALIFKEVPETRRICYNCGDKSPKGLGCSVTIFTDNVPPEPGAQFSPYGAANLMCTATCCDKTECKNIVHSAITTELRARLREFKEAYIFTKCSGCGVKAPKISAASPTPSSSNTFKACGGTCDGMAAYCSSACQACDWKRGHKKVCGKKQNTRGANSDIIVLKDVNKELPHNTFNLLLRGGHAMKGDNDVSRKPPLAVVPFNLPGETFQLDFPLWFAGLAPLGGWDSEWNDKKKSPYKWTDLTSSFAERRPLPVESDDLVICWRAHDAVVSLPGRCPPAYTINALGRRYLVEEAKSRLVDHLSRKDQKEEWGNIPCAEAKKFEKDLEQRLVDLQSAESVFPPNVTSSHEKDMLLQRLKITVVNGFDKSIADSRDKLQKILGTDDHEKQMTSAPPDARTSYQVNDAREKLKSDLTALERVKSGKIRVQPFDSIFETFSDLDIGAAFMDLVMRNCGCDLCPYQDIEIIKIGQDDGDEHYGCQYTIKFGHNYCHSQEAMGTKDMCIQS